MRTSEYGSRPTNRNTFFLISLMFTDLDPITANPKASYEDHLINEKSSWTAKNHIHPFIHGVAVHFICLTIRFLFAM